MIDHVFSDAIGALRDSLESARLERQSAEESFYTDLLTGSTTWRASYSLPGIAILLWSGQLCRSPHTGNGVKKGN